MDFTLTYGLVVTIAASVGFVLAVTSFIAGFRMVKKTGHVAEAMMHRVNGFMTVGLYVLVAVLAIGAGTSGLYVAAWFLGLLIHALKLFIVKKRLAARYGGYVGGMLIITWFVVIFTHLPR